MHIYYVKCVNLWICIPTLVQINTLTVNVNTDIFVFSFQNCCAIHGGTTRPKQVERCSKMTGSFSFAFESAFLQLFGQSDNKYTRPDDYFAEDVMKFIKDFQPDRLMSCVPGRAHPSFPGFVRRTAIRKPAKMGSHIKKLANNMGLLAPKSGKGQWTRCYALYDRRSHVKTVLIHVYPHMNVDGREMLWFSCAYTATTASAAGAEFGTPVCIWPTSMDFPWRLKNEIIFFIFNFF